MLKALFISLHRHQEIDIIEQIGDLSPILYKSVVQNGVFYVFYKT